MPYKSIEEKRAYQRAWVASRRSAWFADKKCKDCGSGDNLELDHVEPRAKVSHRIWTWAKERRLKELVKCVARCEACHAKRSAQQSREIHSRPIRHGTVVGYLNRGCRCDACKARYKIHRRWQYEKNGK